MTVFRLKNRNNDDDNCVITNYYQQGPCSVDQYVMMEMLMVSPRHLFQGIVFRRKHSFEEKHVWLQTEADYWKLVCVTLNLEQQCSRRMFSFNKLLMSCSFTSEPANGENDLWFVVDSVCLLSSLVYSLPHLLLCLVFRFFRFSFALLIFIFCPSFPFYQNSHYSVSRPETVGGDRTWV